MIVTKGFHVVIVSLSIKIFSYNHFLVIRRKEVDLVDLTIWVLMVLLIISIISTVNNPFFSVASK